MFLAGDERLLQVGTVITGEGKVVSHEVSRYGLHRLCVAVEGKYPDVEVWLDLLNAPRVNVRLIHYTEKVSLGVFVGYLWFYFKES